jgi:RHS repeat-associated protein
VRYVLTDHQGTVQALLSDTGALLGNWVWDPWGNIEESWTQRTTDLLYQGKPYEIALGEWYFNARWYNPERGSFTGRDAKLQLYTPYGYTTNSPLGAIDPDGARTIWLGGAGTYENTAAYSMPIVGKMTDQSIADAMWVVTPRDYGEVGKYGRAFRSYFGGDGENAPLVTAWYKREGSEQFNIVGYSQGSVEAVTGALEISRRGGIVDHLILIGTPLKKDGGLLKQAISDNNIKNIDILNVKGDPVSGNGTDLNRHFYFTTNEQGQQDQLVNSIYGFGVR